ncbi:hypothetical protein D3C86_1074720 [compost metagenome]
MNGALIGEIGQLIVYAQDHIGEFVFIEHTCWLVHQPVDLALRQTIDLTEFPKNTAVTERTHCAHKCGMGVLVTGKNVFIDIIPLVPGKINIKIRR